VTDLTKSKQHRLVQVFLSPNGVFEVYVHVEYHNFACTCPGFRARMVCKHTAHVRMQAEAAGGGYPAKMKKNAEQVNPQVLADADRWRQYIIENARVEVL